MQTIDSRNFGLDLLRAIAILSVLISHSFYLLPDPKKYIGFTFGGWFGVQLFFVLSGFLIGTIIINNYDNNFSFKSIQHFWMRRWLRTLPAYLFVITALMLIKQVFDYRYFFFLQGLINFNFDLLPASWSLCIEEWFYLLFP